MTTHPTTEPAHAAYFENDLIASHVARALRRMVPNELDDFASYCLAQDVKDPDIWRGIAYARAHRRAFP